MATTPVNVPIPSIAEATNSAARQLQESLAQAGQAADPAALAPVDLELARSNTRALSFVLGAAVHGAYRYLRDHIASQAIPSRSRKKFLDGWLETYQLPRKPAQAATGTVRGTGVNGSVLASGTLLQTTAGVMYQVTVDSVVAAGVAEPTVMALAAGAAGNIPAGTELTLVSPVTGVDADFVCPSGLSTGADEEQDEEAVYRLQQRLSAPPMGGSPADYARWALAVPGITRAWGLRNPGGATTAGVIIMADNNPAPGLPTVAQGKAVYDYIRDPRRGPPDELFVVIPVPVVINVRLSVAPDTAAIRAGVTAAIRDLFLRGALPGGGIPHSHLVEAISSVVGEYNHTIISPTVTSGSMFTTASYNQLLVPGTVTFV